MKKLTVGGFGGLITGCRGDLLIADVHLVVDDALGEGRLVALAAEADAALG